MKRGGNKKMPLGATLQEKKHSRGLTADRNARPSSSSINSTKDIESSRQSQGVGSAINSTKDIQDSRQSLGIKSSDDKQSMRQRLGNSVDNRLDTSVRSHEDQEARRDPAYRIGKEKALKRGLSQSKASGAGAAAEALAHGEGARSAADKGLAAAAQTKKVQNFRLILAFIRGGSAITLVGIVITILIWGLQLLLGHMMGKEAWKMSKLELILAVPIWAILLVLLAGLLVLYVMLTTSFIKLIGWIFF
jgi:hypothetical protein